MILQGEFDIKRIVKGAGHFPVGAVATAVGMCTLANAYNAIGFSGVRHITMWMGIIVWLIVLFKLVFHFKTFVTEYNQVMPCSLYAAVAMLTAILSSYIQPYIPALGLFLWYAAVIVHAGHILLFTYRNVIKNFNVETFLPTWFVTYVGILVPVVVGSKFGNPLICKALLFYGFAITAFLVPAMFLKIAKYGMTKPTEMTKTIFLAPPSLCLVAYFNLYPERNLIIVGILYGLIFLVTLYILTCLPSFMRRPFNPGFAALTFPMAISLVATLNVANYLTALNHLAPGNFLTQFFGVKLYIITLVIGYVSYNFAAAFVKETFKKEEEAIPSEAV